MTAKMFTKLLFLKYLSLLVLTIQTTTLVMILRYSRINFDENEGNYISSTAIVCSEFIKLIVSLLILSYESGIYCQPIDANNYLIILFFRFFQTIV